MFVCKGAFLKCRLTGALARLHNQKLLHLLPNVRKRILLRSPGGS
jgi:hypothetical protein